MLRFLREDIERILAALPAPGARSVAVDIGAGGSPYRVLLARAGYDPKRLDLEKGDGVDIVGSAEQTNLPDQSVDFILCTQVLEHTRSPWLAMREFARILRPGGAVVISVPHVWFFHPHPFDFWRMTTQGLEALCEEGQLEVAAMHAQGGSAAALFQVLNFLLFGVLGSIGAPLYAAFNGLGMLGNRFSRDTRFALNHACLARKPSAASFAAAAAK